MADLIWINFIKFYYVAILNRYSEEIILKLSISSIFALLLSDLKIILYEPTSLYIN